MSTSAVIVSGLPEDVSQEALQDFFSRVGPVAVAELQGEGRARVEFENAADLDDALHLNGTEYREGVVLSIQAAPAASEQREGSQPAAAEQGRKPRFEEGKAIVVRHLPVPARAEERVRALFGPCGEITDLFVDPRGRFVFVTFATTEAADLAVAKNGEDVEGSAIEVQLRRTEASKRNDARLVVKNLPVAVTEAQVRELFSTAGALTDLFLKADKQLCFISYATTEEADKAMALQGQEIGGNRVEVERREKAKCFTCGKEGHIGAQCRSMTCHNCGKPGHKARECRQPATGRRGPPPPPRRDAVDRRDDFRGGGRRDRDDGRDRRRRRSDSYDRPARRRSRSPPSYRRRSPPSRSPPRQRRRHSRSRSPPRRRY